MTQGYRPQICHRPPIANIPTFPSVGNLQQAFLQEELPALMTKAIIREVEAAHGGFSTTTFYSPKSMGVSIQFWMSKTSVAISGP